MCDAGDEALGYYTQKLAKPARHAFVWLNPAG
jgi:hypothetical protein